MLVPSASFPINASDASDVQFQFALFRALMQRLEERDVLVVELRAEIEDLKSAREQELRLSGHGARANQVCPDTGLQLGDAALSVRICIIPCI